MAREPVSRYDGEALTIVYDRRRCIHNAECGRGSRALFDPKRDPWCDPDAVDADVAVAVVTRCPTGALQVAGKGGAAAEAPAARNTVQVGPHGPLYLRGQVVLRSGDGAEIARETRVALCRCGASSNKPYCDGAHESAGFRDAGPVAADPSGREQAGGELVVTLRPDGPYLLSGDFTLHAASGRPAYDEPKGALCRCGQSKNKPFCDGSHGPAGFKAD